MRAYAKTKVWTELKDIVKGKDTYVTIEEEASLRKAFEDVIERKKLHFDKQRSLVKLNSGQHESSPLVTNTGVQQSYDPNISMERNVN